MYTVAIEVCGVVACGDAETVDSCARQTVGNRTVDFLQSSFRLAGNFSSAKEVYPTATTSANLQLLPSGSLQLDVGPTVIELSGDRNAPMGSDGVRWGPFFPTCSDCTAAPINWIHLVFL